MAQYGETTRDMICGVSADVNKIGVRTITNGSYMKNEEDAVVNALSSKGTSQSSNHNASPRATPLQPLSVHNNSDTTVVKVATPNRAPVNLPTVFEGVKARAFKSWPKNKLLPCFEAEPNWKEALNAPADTGFIYLKGYKTGSSTSSGINLRIARNVARRQGKNFTMCRARYDHAWASSLYSNRIRDKTFMWSIVRNPTSRLMSQFFHFVVSRQKLEPSDANFYSYMKTGPTDMIQDYYLGALSLTGYNRKKDSPVKIANQILEDYDFIGVTERMDESALALAMLMGIPIADILFLTAKGHGGFDDGGGRGGVRTCTYIWPSFVSDGMQEYLDSDEWASRQHWDLVLYEAVNRSLDLTIDRLGRERFEKNLALYEKARELSRTNCLHKTVFPCSSGGKYTEASKTDCLWNDSGCGSECLDEVADKLDLWSKL